MLRQGLLSLNPDQHLCLVGGTQVTLTAAEMTLLAHLIQHPTRVYPRGRLTQHLWPDSDLSDRTLDSHLRNLRRKLAEAGCTDAIDSLHGIGLRMGTCLQ
jgi:two-component system OmpR family response regulator